MGFDDYLKGMEHTGQLGKFLKRNFGVATLQELSGKQFMQLFKTYEERTAHLHVEDKEEDSEPNVPATPTQDDELFSMPSFLEESAAKKKTVQVSGDASERVTEDIKQEPINKDEYTEEQQSAFTQLLQLEKQYSKYFSVDLGSTPRRVSIKMGGGGNMLFTCYSAPAVQCLANMKRKIQDAEKSGLLVNKTPDELSK